VSGVRVEPPPHGGVVRPLLVDQPRVGDGGRRHRDRHVHQLVRLGDLDVRRAAVGAAVRRVERRGRRGARADDAREVRHAAALDDEVVRLPLLDEEADGVDVGEEGDPCGLPRISAAS
jgi:hypothetical protein